MKKRLLLIFIVSLVLLAQQYSTTQALSDGDYIFYESYAGSTATKTNINRINPDGTGGVAYAEGVGFKISPNKAKIAYTRIIPDGMANTNSDIFVANIDGNNEVNLTQNNLGSDSIEGWSPDGSKILFYSDRNNTPGVYSMDSDGANTQLLSDNSVDLPEWSPDGNRILARKAENNKVGVITFAVDGSDPVFVVPLSDSFSVQTAQWSPDGSKILFSTSNQTGQAVGVVHRDGTNLNFVAGKGFKPKWSPDATRIAWESDTICSISGSLVGYQLSVMNNDGTGKHNIACGVTAAWSPDGTKIAFNTYDQSSSSPYSLYITSLEGGQPSKIADYPENSGSNIQWIAKVQDTGLPQGSFTGTTPVVIRILGQTISGTASDAISGVATIRLEVGSLSLVPGEGLSLSCNSLRTSCSWTASSALLPSGRNDYTLTIIDRSGNQHSISKQYNVI